MTRAVALQNVLTLQMEKRGKNSNLLRQQNKRGKNKNALKQLTYVPVNKTALTSKATLMDKVDALLEMSCPKYRRKKKIKSPYFNKITAKKSREKYMKSYLTLLSEYRTNCGICKKVCIGQKTPYNC